MSVVIRTDGYTIIIPREEYEEMKGCVELLGDTPEHLAAHHLLFPQSWPRAEEKWRETLQYTRDVRKRERVRKERTREEQERHARLRAEGKYHHYYQLEPSIYLGEDVCSLADFQHWCDHPLPSPLLEGTILSDDSGRELWYYDGEKIYRMDEEVLPAVAWRMVEKHVLSYFEDVLWLQAIALPDHYVVTTGGREVTGPDRQVTVCQEFRVKGQTVTVDGVTYPTNLC